jgi:hypothetical protein
MNFYIAKLLVFWYMFSYKNAKRQHIDTYAAF